ncbi:hypothetical protein SGRIM119S_08023 [Streptomyces griseorubiginosus]
MDPVPLGELGHHEQPDAAVRQQAGHIHLIGVRQQRVHPLLFGDRHTEPTVLDLDREPRGHQVGPQQHLGVRGREHRRVLDEFGQQMDDVGDGMPPQRAVDRRHQLDPRVLLDLGDGRTQHLGHRDGVAPLPPRDRTAEHREVLGVPPDPGREVVDVEEPLEQVGILDLVLQLVENRDLPVHQRLKPPGEVDEHLQLLFAAGLAGELGGLDDGRDGSVVRARQIGREQLEVVGALGRTAARSTPRRHLPAPQSLDQRPQFGFAARAAAAQCADPVAHRGGGSVGRHRGDQDARECDRERAAEDTPQDESGPCPRGADGEQDRRAAAEGHRDRREHGQAQQLRPYVRLRQRGCGAGDLPAVPPALTAVCARGRCTEVRHRCPCSGPWVLTAGVPRADPPSPAGRGVRPGGLPRGGRGDG